MQNSNNAYMLVYTSSSALAAIRAKSKELPEMKNSPISGDSKPISSPLTPSNSSNRKSTSGSAALSASARKKLANNGENNSSNCVSKLENGPLPIYLKAFIEQDRRVLEDEIKEQLRVKHNKHKEQISLKTRMKSVYER